MSYSGIYIKPNSTTQDFQKIIDSYYNGILSMREMEENMRIQNEKYEIHSDRLKKIKGKLSKTIKHQTPILPKSKIKKTKIKLT